MFPLDKELKGLVSHLLQEPVRLYVNVYLCLKTDKDRGLVFGFCLIEDLVQ